MNHVIPDYNGLHYSRLQWIVPSQAYEYRGHKDSVAVHLFLEGHF